MRSGWSRISKRQRLVIPPSLAYGDIRNHSIPAYSTLVFEIGFEGIQASPRHKSGVAVRFPRMLRWRTDKHIDDADTLTMLKGFIDERAR